MLARPQRRCRLRRIGLHCAREHTSHARPLSSSGSCESWLSLWRRTERERRRGSAARVRVAFVHAQACVASGRGACLAAVWSALPCAPAVREWASGGRSHIRPRVAHRPRARCPRACASVHASAIGCRSLARRLSPPPITPRVCWCRRGGCIGVPERRARVGWTELWSR